jgi:hypothetical protein
MRPQKGLARDTPAVYQIQVQGVLDSSWSDRMNGADIRMRNLPNEAPVTVITGHFTDQTALSGVLSTLYDLGFVLLSVEQLSAYDARTGV